MAIFNATPHTVNLYNEEDTFLDTNSRKLIVKPGAQPYQVIPADPKGRKLNAQSSQTDCDRIDGIPIKQQTFTGVDDPSQVFPEATGDDFVITSALYVSAAKQWWGDLKLLTVGGVVYSDSDNPRPVGCLYLILN